MKNVGEKIIIFDARHYILHTQCIVQKERRIKKVRKQKNNGKQSEYDLNAMKIDIMEPILCRFTAKTNELASGPSILGLRSPNK